MNTSIYMNRIIPKMNILAILISLYIICIMLLVGCASTSRPVYVGKTMSIALKSSPEGARVLVDGQQKGYTPMTLEFTYLIGSKGNDSDDTGERIVKIEKEGYEPYILSISTKGKDYETMPSLILIKKLDDVIKEEDLPNEEEEKTQELKESRKKAKEALEEIERLRKEIALLKEEKETQEIIHEHIEVLSAADRIEKELEPEKDIVLDKEYKNDDNATNSNKKTMPDDQHASQGIYTIQTGSFVEIELAQKQFDSVMQVLNEKELDYLRIEKVGKYYSVRLGKFLDYASAEGFLQALEPQLAEPIILKANIKDDRIIRIYDVGERPSL